VFWFSTFIGNISHSKRNSGTYFHKFVLVSMQKYPSFFSYLIKLELSPQMFEKYSNIKFHENSFSGSRIVFMVTDRRDKACRGFVEAAKN